MGKKLLFYLISILLIGTLFSCTLIGAMVSANTPEAQDIHMYEIVDVYEKRLSFPIPGVYGSALSASGYTIEEMRDLLVSDEVSSYVFRSEKDYIILPREGDFYAFPFEKFTAKVGPCYLTNVGLPEYRISFKLRIFNSQGYLIAEDTVTTYLYSDYQEGRVIMNDSKIEKYWAIIAERFYQNSMEVSK